MLTYFDCCKIPIICQIVDLILKGKIVNKSYFTFAKELMSMTMKNYVHYSDEEVLPIGTYGGYFPAVVANPTKYI